MSPRRTSMFPRFWIALGLALGIAPIESGVWAAAPADPLLRLVPADAALTIVVEDLIDHLKAIRGTALAKDLGDLPSVRDWLASDGGRGLRHAGKALESALGGDLSKVRDALFGEAFTLTLRLPPGAPPDQARGLLLARASDRATLDRLINALNSAQLRSGELLRVDDRRRGATAYHAREFRPVPRPRDTEYYAIVNERTLAWSNSEDLIRDVIDRQGQAQEAGGLLGHPDVGRLRKALPRNALVSLYLDPRFVERVMATAAAPRGAADEGGPFAVLGQYFRSVRYAGAALEWRNGLILHTEEAVDPEAIAPGLKRWVARTEPAGPESRRVSASAVLMVTGNVDVNAACDLLAPMIPTRDRPKLDNFSLALKGLLLGLDARRDVAPHLGPSMLYYIERPDGEGGPGRPPMVVSIELPGDETSRKAIAGVDNAFKTFLAVYALDGKHGGGQLKVETRTEGDATITTLSPTTPLAYAIRPDRLIVGTSAAAVGRALKAMADPRTEDRVERVRSTYFPGAGNFALADLRAIYNFADRRRPALARRLSASQHRPESDCLRDLDQVLALVHLFDAAFLTTDVAPDFSRVGHAVGLVRIGSPRP